MSSPAIDAGRPVHAADYPALLDLLGRSGVDVVSMVTGDSMGVTLPAGSRIRIRAINRDGLREGQVVTFATPAGLVTHRIVRRGHSRTARGFVLTRGDARILCDPPLHLDAIAGVATEYWDGVRWTPIPPAPAVAGRYRAIAALARIAPAIALEVNAGAALAINVAFFKAAQFGAAALGAVGHRPK